MRSTEYNFFKRTLVLAIHSRCYVNCVGWRRVSLFLYASGGDLIRLYVLRQFIPVWLEFLVLFHFFGTRFYELNQVSYFMLSKQFHVSIFVSCAVIRFWLINKIVDKNIASADANMANIKKDGPKGFNPNHLIPHQQFLWVVTYPKDFLYFFWTS